jgi:hypothetical protein
MVHRWAKKRIHNIDRCKYRIIILRDPLERFVSMFANKVHHQKRLTRQIIDCHLASAPCKHQIPEHPDIHQFIRHFSEYNKVPLIRHHAKPQHEFMDGHSLDYFTHIFFVDKMDLFFHFLEDITGKPVPHYKKQTSQKEKFLPLLGPQEIDWIHTLYANDFTLLSQARSRHEIHPIATEAS